jgi:hypothetical protein
MAMVEAPHGCGDTVVAGRGGFDGCPQELRIRQAPHCSGVSSAAPQRGQAVMSVCSGA